MAVELGLSIDSSGMKPGLADLDTLVQKSQAAEQAATKMGQTVSGAMNEVAQSTKRMGEGYTTSFDMVGKAASGAASQFEPLIAAEQKHKSTVADVAATVAAGALAQKTANAATDAATKSVNEAANAHAGLSTQGQAAFHTVRSLGEQLAYGVPLTQALTSHINQLSFAASGPQGLTGAFAEAIGTFGRLIPAGAGVALAVAGIGAAALGAAAHWQSAESDINRALLGIGGASQATVKDIEGISAALSSTNKLSFGEARDAATAIASLGTVNVKLFSPLVDASKDLSIVLGTDVTTAAKTAGAAIGDLGHGSTDGILKLNQSLGFLSGTLLENIQNLVASGKSFEAQKVAIDAVAKSSQGAQSTLSVWGIIGQTFSNFTSDVVNKTGAAITAVTGLGESVSDQYERAASRLKELQDVAARSGSGGGLLGDAIKKQADAVANLKKQLDAESLAEFNKQQDQLGLKAKLVADSVAGEYKQAADLKIALADINKGPDATSGSFSEQVTAARRLTEEIKNRQNVDGSVLTIEQQQTQVFEAQLALVSARGASEKEDATAAMARAQALGTANNAELAATRAVALERAQINTAYENSLELLQAQSDVASAKTGADQIDAQEQLSIVQLLQQGLTLEQATAIAAQQRANSEDAVDASVERQVKSLQQQTELIRARQNGTEAQVAAAQAYKNAIDAGASSADASALSSATLENYMARAASASGKFASDMSNAASSIGQAAAGMNGVDAALSSETSNFRPSSMDKVEGTVQIAPIASGPKAFSSDQLTNIINKALSSGLGLGGAAQTILDLYSGHGGPAGFLMPKGLDDTAVQAISNLTDMMTKGGDTAGATSFLQSELANVQQQPETLARDQLISQLNDQLKQLTDATNQNTSATQSLSVGMDSIYSGGHSALAIGYYQEGQTNYNYDPNGFFQGGKNYTAPSQPYDPNAGLQVPASSPSPTTQTGGSGGSSTPNFYSGLSTYDLLSALGYGTTPGSPVDSMGIPHFADGGVIPPHTLAYVGEHGPNPRLIRTGDEPVTVTPFDMQGQAASGDGMGPGGSTTVDGTPVHYYGADGAGSLAPIDMTAKSAPALPSASSGSTAGSAAAAISAPTDGGIGPGGTATYNGIPVHYYADGGTLEPYSLGVVGEHGPSPRLIQSGAEPILVTPGVPSTSGIQKTASAPVYNFYQTFNTKANDLGDRRTRRQVADGFGNAFRARAS